MTLLSEDTSNSWNFSREPIGWSMKPGFPINNWETPLEYWLSPLRCVELVPVTNSSEIESEEITFNSIAGSFTLSPIFR